MQQSRITPEQYDAAKAICIAYQAQCKEEYERTLNQEVTTYTPKTRIVDLDTQIPTKTSNGILALTMDGGILDKRNFQDLTLANIASVGFTRLIAQKGVGARGLNELKEICSQAGCRMAL